MCLSQTLTVHSFDFSTFLVGDRFEQSLHVGCGHCYLLDKDICTYSTFIFFILAAFDIYLYVLLILLPR